MACMIMKRCWRCNKEYQGWLDDGKNGLGRCTQCEKEVKALLSAAKLEQISAFTIKQNA